MRRLWIVLIILLLAVSAAYAQDTGLATPTDLIGSEQEEAAVPQHPVLVLRPDDGGWIVTGCKDLDTISLVIPGMWQDQAVVGIAEDAFRGLEKLQRVTVNQGVRTIAARAFSDCPALTSVSMPRSVTAIHPNAFSGSMLVVITAPENSFAAQFAAENGLAPVLKQEDEPEPDVTAPDAGEDRHETAPKNPTPSTPKQTTATPTDLAALATATDLLANVNTDIIWPIVYHLNDGTNAPDNPDGYVQGVVFTLEDPVREGYTFAGWYTDRSLSRRFGGFKASTKGKITVYAKWTANKYTILYDGNGADNVAPYKQKLTWNKSAALSANQYKLKAYTFVEWNTEADGTGIAYTNKQRVSCLTPENGAVITLYAQWKPTVYNIVYKLNSGTNDPLNPSTYTLLDEVTFAAPQRPGHMFDGWYADSRCQVPMVGIEIGSSGNKTVYAKWISNRFELRYHDNAESDAADYSQRASCAGSVTLTANQFTYRGCKFDGWNTAPDGSGTSFADRARIKQPAYEDGEVIDLYAQWRPIKYTITYKLNGGKASEENPQTYTVLDTVNFTDPIRAGYHFVGWYSDSQFKKTVTSLEAGTTGSKTLYARWGINRFTVVFDPNGAPEAEPFEQLIPCAAGGTLAANCFKWSGNTFMGWNTEPDGSGTSYANKKKITDGPQEDGAVLTLYACWGPNLRTVKVFGTNFEVVGLGADPIAFARLTDGKICQIVGDQTFPDYCMSFAYYYAGCIIKNKTDLVLKDGLKYLTNGAKVRTEQFSTEQGVLRRLYNLLNTGMPQVLMVKATHNSRHFVTVVGYKSSVKDGNTIRATDLLIIDSHDGKLESMDPALFSANTRILYTQGGKYRLETFQ